MKLKSKREIELEKEIFRYKELLIKAKKENQPDAVTDFLTDNIDAFQNELKEIRNRTKAPKTYFTVEFIHPHKIIDSGTSKENYILSIREFGIENIKGYIPDFFQGQEEKGFERLEPNIYLDIRKNNASMISSLKTIAKKTGRKIVCKLTS